VDSLQGIAPFGELDLRALIESAFAPIPVRVETPRAEKACSQCGAVLPLDAFNRECRTDDAPTCARTSPR
jgi:hypothetical protein